MKPQGSARLVAGVALSSQGSKGPLQAKGSWRRFCDRTVTLGQEKMSQMSLESQMGKPESKYPYLTLYIPHGHLLN